MFWIRLPSKAVILKPKDPGDCSTCGICSRPMKFRHASPDSTLLCQNEANVNGRTCSSTGGDISSVMRRNELSSVRPDFTIHLKRSQPPAAASYISGNVKIEEYQILPAAVGVDFSKYMGPFTDLGPKNFIKPILLV